MPSYGGEWTKQKLEVLKEYLNSYTTALKNQPFKLLYIDAFAGSGVVELRDRDKYGREFIVGSALIAVQTEDKPFDELIFVEQNSARHKSLCELKEAHSDRNIVINCTEANDSLQRLCAKWEETHSGCRGVLFLDPFATQVEWKTVEAVASTQALDVWILFPVSAIARMLPTSKKPDDVSETWASRLNLVFGNDSWRKLYDIPTQSRLFDGKPDERTPGLDGIVRIYKQNLKEIVGDRLLDKTKFLTNSTSSPLFALVFFAGNSAGTKIAHRIAGHLLGNI